jgi:hypothetical protein
LQVTAREAAKERAEGMEPTAVYASPLIFHYDKTHLDAIGAYVLALVYMTLENYSREMIERSCFGYMLVAFIPIPKPEAFARNWIKTSPQYR